MRIPALTLCMITLALAACAGQTSKPASPYLAVPVKDVSQRDRPRYWLEDGPSMQGLMLPSKACFRATALIDSNGWVFEPKVLALVGDGMAEWLPEFFAKLRFDATPMNIYKTPVRSTLTWTFRKTTVVGEGWDAECKAEMDKQMGITATPAAATAAPPH